MEVTSDSIPLTVTQSDDVQTPPKSLHDRFWEASLGLHHLDKAVSIDRMYKQAKSVRNLVSKVQNGKLGQEGGGVDEDDETVFHVGDETNHIHIMGDGKTPALPVAPTPTPTPTPTPPTPTPTPLPAPTTGSWVGPVTIAAALAMGTLGGIAGHWWFASPDTDTDTWSILVPLEPSDGITNPN